MLPPQKERPRNEDHMKEMFLPVLHLYRTHSRNSTPEQGGVYPNISRAVELEVQVEIETSLPAPCQNTTQAGPVVSRVLATLSSE